MVGPKFRGAPKSKPAQSALLAKTQAQLNQAMALHQQGRLGQAKEIYEGILRVSPQNADALHLLGVVAAQTKNYQAAADLIGKAIEINPNSAAYYSNRGLAQQELRQLKEAVSSYDKAISLEPKSAEAHNNRGNALSELKQLEAAVASYDKAISLKPGYAEAHSNRGNALKDLNQLELALDNYDKAISLRSDYAEAIYNRGIALQELKQLEAAVASYDKVISLKPDYAEAFYNRGIALQELKQLEAALSNYDKAISLKPDYFEAHNNRGNALKDQKQLEAALDSYDKAISLKSDYAEAHNNRGNALKVQKQLEAAVSSYDTAISLKPNYAEAYSNRGNALVELRQFDAAVESYERALSLKLDHDYLLGSLLHARMHLCDWKELDERVAELFENIHNDAKASVSFNVLSLSGSLSVQRKAAEIYSQDKYPASAQPMWSGQRYEHARIRVAYVSGDFKLHPATLNNIQMWEMHDRSRFEVISISYGPVVQQDSTVGGQLRTRLLKAFDRFLDVGDKSDEEIAQLMRDMEIDIAVDISGTMQDGRQGILAHRPAPVQVNLCGFTSGAPYIDYIIEDRVVIPLEHEWGYTEKVVCLPYARLPNDTTRQVSARQFTRGELGLPEVGVVYCSFNNAYKFNPQMFDVWMRILQRVPGSVLWLQGGGQEGVKENLRREASARGVDPDRLVFAVKIESMADHLARHRAADVFLDTLPFNAQTTAVDALWAGLPVLTCLGESAIGRTAGSVLMALGMDELVTKDWQAYEAQAVRIGLESSYAKSLKDKLERNRKEAPLFDTQRLTRNMESAYEQMHERVQQGLRPQEFEVRVSDGA